MKRRVFIVLVAIFFIATGLPVYGVQVQQEGFREVARTERFILLYNDAQAVIELLDRVDGYTWNSYVSEDHHSFKSANKLFQNSMKSMFNMEYINIGTKRIADSIHTNPLSQKAEILVRNIRNGINVQYDFKSIGISIALDVWLDEDSLNVRIPEDGVIERDNFVVTSIELMPFFGAADGTETGYLFYPDGSGGLHYFKEKPDNNAKQYEMYIYGSDEIDTEKIRDNKFIEVQPAMLPVYGMKKGRHAFLAVINEGEYDACIIASPSGNKVDLNRIFPRFTFRRKYRKAEVGQLVELGVEKKINDSERSVKYLFLSDGNADYSGMANAYRQYLMDSGNIRKAITDGDGISLGLDLFMGIKEKQILIDKFVRMTTFGEAKEILQSFKDLGVRDIDVNLIGWVKGGYGTEPVHMPPERALGGRRGLGRLLEYTHEYGIRLFLQDNYVDAFSENGGFSKRSDIAYQINKLPVSDMLGEWFLLNPVRVWKNFINKILASLLKYDIDGINFEQFGKFIYYDYNEKYPVRRRDTADYWTRFLEKSRDSFGHAASLGGNAYVLKHVDRLYDIPYKDNGCFITDRAVPFYQMVVHGCIPYSSSPGNLSHDLDWLKLKWVEYGYMPSFQLAYRKADLIKYTSYNDLFTSQYTKWMGRASDIYMEFNKRLSDIWASFMVRHEEIQNNVFAITYDNGCMVYVNYNNNTVIVEGHEIKGMDYLVIMKGGTIK